MPAETCRGTAGASARIRVSAMMTPGAKRAITGAGKIGLSERAQGRHDLDGGA